MKNKLIKSSLLYSIGNLLTQGLSFITLPIYIRVMSVDDYGVFSIYSAWLGMLTIFISLQIPGSFAIAKNKYQDEFDEYTRSSLFVPNICSILFFLVFLIFRNYFEKFTGFNSLVSTLLIFQSFLAATSNICYQYFVQQQESTKQLILSIITSLLNVAISLHLLLNYNLGYLARIIGTIVPSILVGIYFYSYILPRTKKIFQKKYLKFMLLTSIPLIFHILGHQLLSQLDRIMLGSMVGTTQTAIYNFNYSIASIFQISTSGFVVAWVPWWMEHKKLLPIKQINKYSFLYFNFMTFLAIGFLTIYPELISIIGKGIYQQNNDFILFIILGYYFGFMYTIPVNIQFLHENTKFIPIGTFLAAGLNFLLNSLLIPNYGIEGAAIATLVSYILLFIFHHIISKLLYKYNDINLKTFIFNALFVSLYSYFILIFKSSLIIRWASCLIIFSLYCIYFKKDLFTFLQSILHTKKVSK